MSKKEGPGQADPLATVVGNSIFNLANIKKVVKMKLDKAIEIARDSLLNSDRRWNIDEYNAFMIGLESMKRIKGLREGSTHGLYNLPGENTGEDKNNIVAVSRSKGVL